MAEHLIQAVSPLLSDNSNPVTKRDASENRRVKSQKITLPRRFAGAVERIR